MSEGPRGAPPTWPRLRYVAAAALVVLLVGGAFRVLAAMQDILLLAFIGVLLGAFLDVPVRYMSRFIPRPLATVITLLFVVTLIGGIVWLSLPIITNQAQQLIDRAPAAIDQVASWWSREVGEGSEIHEVGRQLRTELMSQIGGMVGSVVPAALTAATAISLFVVLVILAAFLAYEPGTYLAGIVGLAPERHRRLLEELLHRIGQTLKGWMAGTVMGMFVVGTMTAVGLLILGVDSWFVLGILAFFGEFVPYVGPVASAIPGIALAMTESSTLGIYTLLLYLAVQQSENLFMPIIMRRTVRLEPALLIIFQLGMAAAFGFLGVIVATPLLACISVAVKLALEQNATGAAP